MTGFVYAVKCGEYVKIGWSSKPESRASKINSDNPMPCWLIGFREGTKKDERAIQRRFGAYHFHSEWFRYEGDVVAFCNSLPPAPTTGRTYATGRKFHRPHRISLMRSLAKRHGEMAEWERELGLYQGALTQWRSIPDDWIADVARVTGITASRLREVNREAAR